jgi:putative transposase
MPGRYYLITIVSERRIAWFSIPRNAEAVVAILHEDGVWRDSKALCWVLMPDHLHVLLRLGASEALPQLLNRLKSVTAQAANRAAGRHGPLWMRSYHDRALREEDDVLSVARYVLGNPVRAGIVQTVDAYPYWVCAWGLDVLIQSQGSDRR